jgi:hypothetical protein
MKIKENFTIDEELSKWIKSQTNFKSSSEFLNNILLREYQSKNNAYYLLENILAEKERIESEETRILSLIKKIKDEGNEKEKTEAIKTLKEREEFRATEETRIKNTIKEFYIFCESFGFKEMVKKVYSLNDLDVLLNLLSKYDFENKNLNSRKLIDFFGVRSRILEDIKLNNNCVITE